MSKNIDNFAFWVNEIADIPEKDDSGEWRDLETGLYFDNGIDYRAGGETTFLSPPDCIKKFREVAKFYGAKALTGSAKQKEWAERIRFDILTSDCLSDEQKADLLYLEGVVNTSRFWISNRKLKASEFIASDLIYEYKETYALISSNKDNLYSKYTGEINKAKIAIYNKLKSNKFSIRYEFRHSDDLYHYSELKKLKVNNDSLVAA